MLRPSIFGNDGWNDWMDFSFPDFDQVFYGKPSNHIMKTDVKETSTGYEVDMELPGFRKEDVQAKLKDGYITINAVKNVDQGEKNQDGKYIRRERYMGNMSRSFYVGKDITENDIHAKFENGILKLAIPKKEAAKPVEENHFVTIEG